MVCLRAYLFPHVVVSISISYESVSHTFWLESLQNVLRMDPEASMKKGDNPGPLVELTFWESRAANLNSIRAQISSGKISKVIRILELAENTYYHSFSRQIAEVSAAVRSPVASCFFVQ